MVRPRRARRIFWQPDITYFKPVGVPLNSLDEVVLSFEEIEAIRIVDLEGIKQEEAAEMMEISQPTLSRLLKEGRKKLAYALINGLAIRIQGGSFKMAQPEGGAGLGRGFGRGRGRMGGRGAGPGGICKCPNCGYEEPQIRGEPCVNKKCPKCGTRMIRA